MPIPETAVPTVLFRVPPMALLAVPFALIFISPAALSEPAWLGWLLVLPLLYAAWLLRLRTTVDGEGLRVRGLWSSRGVQWERVCGIRFPRSRFRRFTVAVLNDRSELRLPCVTFRDLPALSTASAGRIPDPFAAAA